MDVRTHTEILACRLILAYLLDDPVEMEFQVYAVGDESELPYEQFRLANYTAATAAQFWRDTNPRLARKLLTERLGELTAVAS
jgi:hypothetical protein